MSTRAADQASAQILKTCLQLLKDAGGLSRDTLKNTLTKLDFDLSNRLVNLRVNSVILRARSSQFIEEENGQLTVTSAGVLQLQKLIRITDFKFLKSQPWDNKWRLLSYDVPETERQLRNELRALIKQADFTLLQRSLWITPYACEKLLEDLLDNYPDYVQLFIVSSIKGDMNFSANFKNYID